MWSLTQVRTLAKSRGWMVDVVPDYERGFVGASGARSRIAVTLECGFEIDVSSHDGILNGCLPELNELGLTPFKEG